jgi:hypothetical protein
MANVCRRVLLLLTLGLAVSACGKETAYLHSACFDEYVSLVKVTSYSSSLDAALKGESLSEDSSRTCGSLFQAVERVEPEELGDLQKAVQEAGASNDFVLCLSEIITTVGITDDLSDPIAMTALDTSNTLLFAASQPLAIDQANQRLTETAVDRFRVDEEGLLEGDRECRRKHLGWPIP